MRRVSKPKTKNKGKVIFEEIHNFYIGKECSSCKGKALIRFEARNAYNCPYCKHGIKWRSVSAYTFNKEKRKHGVE